MSMWWKKLGLKMTIEGRPDDRRIRAREQALATLVPVWPQDGRQRLALADVVGIVTDPAIALDDDRNAQTAGREYGWAQIQAAFEAPDAEQVITRGLWKGFTRARAKAWMWTLVQYPHATSEIFYGRRYRERIAALEAGKLVEDAHDARTARAREADGTSPQEYRRALELIGERVFTGGSSIDW